VPSPTLIELEKEIALKEQILFLLKDGQPHYSTDLLAALLHPAPGNPAPENSAKCGKLFQQALKQLSQETRITISQEPGDSEPKRLIQLVPPTPDPQFEIDPAFRDLLPPPSPGELAELERQLLTEQCLEPLIVWKHEGRTYLIDGHTRLVLCLRHGLKYEIRSMEFPSRDAVVRWIWGHHCGRRNLTPEATSYARGCLVHSLGLSRGGDHRSERAKRQSAALKQRIIEVADRFQVARRTVERDRTYAQALDAISAVCGPALRTRVLGRVLLLPRCKAGRTHLEVLTPQGFASPYRHNFACMDAITARRRRTSRCVRPGCKVEQLAERDEAEMKQLVAKLLAGEKVHLTPPRAEVVRLTLHRGRPQEQADTLVKKLGVEAVAVLTERLTRCLNVC
jgi:hypothetical protein